MGEKINPIKQNITITGEVKKTFQSPNFLIKNGVEKPAIIEKIARRLSNTPRFASLTLNFAIRKKS